MYPWRPPFSRDRRELNHGQNRRPPECSTKLFSTLLLSPLMETSKLKVQNGQCNIVVVLWKLKSTRNLRGERWEETCDWIETQPTGVFDNVLQHCSDSSTGGECWQAEIVFVHCKTIKLFLSGQNLFRLSSLQGPSLKCSITHYCWFIIQIPLMPTKKKKQCCLDVLFALKQIFFIVSLLPVDRNLSPKVQPRAFCLVRQSKSKHKTQKQMKKKKSKTGQIAKMFNFKC